MNIKKIRGEIIKVIDLSKTAKEIEIKLSEPIDFLPGSFINLFIDVNGEIMRRAYSISSSSSNRDTLTLTVRLSLTGVMTQFLWSTNLIGKEVDLMGPLGLNTVDKMKHDKIYLFAFGIGVGVVKSISDYFINIKKVKSLTIYTGSRQEDEIIYKEYFDKLSQDFDNVVVKYIVSSPLEGSNISKGYIQDHVDNLDFNNSDVYVCGQEKACSDLVNKINSLNPKDCNFYIEGFH
jgi:NAD(P)H-flavin reductase